MLDAALKAQGGGGAVGFVQNQHDKVRLMGGDGSICGALAAQPGAKGQTFVADSTTNIQPIVLASGQANAELEMGGGVPDADAPARTSDNGRSCTSNGEDVFPSLCATDGSKQFIDNQSVNGGRLILYPFR